MSLLKNAVYYTVLATTTGFYGFTGALALAWEYIRNGRAPFARIKHEEPEVLKGWKHGYLKLSEINMHYVETGDPSKPLLLLVHGFPEFWYSYRHQLKYFERDYHVVAIDLRGYGGSDKPTDLASYSSTKLVNDLAEVIPALGRQRAFVVAHDWGGALAWILTAVHPELVEKLVILNVPHPFSFRKFIASTWKQFRLSWYMFFFVNPWLPELFMRRNDLASLIAMFRNKKVGLVNSENFTDADEAAWKYAFSGENAFTGPLNFYRAFLLRINPLPLPATPIQPETLIIWGEKDGALAIEAAEDSLRHCRSAKIHKIPNASHWVQQDAPEEVNRAIENFLRAEPIEIGEGVEVEHKASL
uniref:AB hydrolase-1 domain-containing protein n=1 Tax=Panagrellus redivivus TaxID=6233 RepID=A0A7E4W0F2_PANRE